MCCSEFSFSFQLLFLFFEKSKDVLFVCFVVWCGGSEVCSGMSLDGTFGQVFVRRC